jgi:WD40 repeat protein
MAFPSRWDREFESVFLQQRVFEHSVPSSTIATNSPVDRGSSAVKNRFEGHEGRVDAVAFGAVDGRPVLVSGSSDRTIRLWDARSGVPIAEPIVGHKQSVTAVAFGTVDGRTIVVSGSNDATILVWDARTHRSLLAAWVGEAVTSLGYLCDFGILVGMKTGLLALEIRVPFANEAQAGDAHPRSAAHA